MNRNKPVYFIFILNIFGFSMTMTVLSHLINNIVYTILLSIGLGILFGTFLGTIIYLINKPQDKNR